MVQENNENLEGPTRHALTTQREVGGRKESEQNVKNQFVPFLFEVGRERLLQFILRQVEGSG